MEAPLEQKRLSPSPGADDETSDVDLHEARAQNDMRLKSIFEGIFEKYGRDFTDVGDEIDLQTGDIMVNNGHINALEREDDPGDWLSDVYPDWQDPSNQQVQGTDEEENASARPNGHAQEAGESHQDEKRGHSGHRVVSILSHMRPDPERSGQSNAGDSDGAAEAEDDRSSVDSLLDSALSLQRLRNRKAEEEKASSRPSASNQSHAAATKRLDETVDPAWRVPEISAKFTTPTFLDQPKPKRKINTVRSQSPPGARSIWALPWTTRRNTDGFKTKQKDSPKKQKKHHSSPPIGDWSFAEAPDGDESDDPLQEDYEPSPTPKRSVYIREKRKGPLSASGDKDTCTFCKKMLSRDDYVSHLKAVLSDPADTEHDSIYLKKQLATITGDGALGLASAEHNVRPTNTPISQSDSKAQETTHESTPTGTKRVRTILGPEEARSIIHMKQIQGKKWKEITDHFPQKKLTNIRTWHHFHWNQRKVNPPKLSGPWTSAELEKLEMLKDQPGLTWPGIRAELPGRLLAEVEFKLLQLWAGDVSQESSSSQLKYTN